MRYRHSLKKQLLRAPFTFEFAQAAHILYGQEKTEQSQKIFFRSTLTLSPSSSDIIKIKPIHHVQFGKINHKWQSQPPKNQTTFLNIHVNFFGISGSHGPLPLAYTERIFHNIKRQDHVCNDFLDIFNHRFLTIFFKIKQKFYPVLNWSPPQESSVGTILSSLSGYQPILKNGFSERALLRLSQVFWKKPHTPEGLARLLSHHFNVPVSIIPFQGAWHTIPKNQRTFLVRNGRNILGHNFMVGQRAWCQDDGVLVKIKISSIDLFLNLLPGGKHYFSIYSLIRLYLNPRFHFKIVLQLSKTHTFSLGSQKGPFFLGWTSWIGHPRTQETTVVISKPPQRSLVYNERYTSSMT